MWYGCQGIQDGISNFTSTCQKYILNILMDKQQNDVRVHVIRCQYRYYFKEIQLLKDVFARLQWPAYSYAICDFCLYINPNLMMPWLLKHLQLFVRIFVFSVWPWERFSAGTSNSPCLAQTGPYIYEHLLHTCYFICISLYLTIVMVSWFLK